MDKSTWIKEIIEKVLFPILVGGISYLLFRGLDERKKRKNYSKLGIAIIRTLLEEVNTGLSIIKANLSAKSPKLLNLPTASWININTIPDEVLLRIISVSENEDKRGDYHPQDIRSHMKNYFEHMSVTWGQKVTIVSGYISKGLPAPRDLEDTAKSFQRPAEHVKIMLEQTIQLLEANSKKWVPK
jgi:hypothetical protein